MRRPTPALRCARLLWLGALLGAGLAQAQSQPPAGAPVQGGMPVTVTASDPLMQMLQARLAALPSAMPAAGLAGLDAPARALLQARDAASELVLSAMNFLGVPYRRGGSAADEGFDCSGFTRHVFESSLGIVLPRRAAEQARKPGLQTVPKDELAPGDLVFFNTMRRAFSHVGIYIGEGRFIHAPRAGGEVRIERMDARYWTTRFNGARRAALPDPTPASLRDTPGTAAPGASAGSPLGDPPAPSSGQP
jgi:cell wall-associated NlpC family hydrolase